MGNRVEIFIGHSAGMTSMNGPERHLGHADAGSLHVVETVGEYGVGGLERMARGLALRGLNIVRLTATRDGGSSRTWRLVLHTDAHPGAYFDHPPPDVESELDAREAYEALMLWTCRITRQGERVEVATSAPDALGLLGRVLGALGMHGLFPARVEATTVAGVARQRLLLTGLAGRRPTDEALQAASRFLAQHTKSRKDRLD